MSRFAWDKLNGLSPYVPGEQPRDRKYIKLNTNENPYFTSERAIAQVTRDMLENLKLYSDPECTRLVRAIARYYGVDEECVLVTNGSDEALAFCFQAYCREGVCFADPEKYFCCGRTVVIANPNAQTGIALGGEQLESIISSNSRNIVIVDQAYADFSGFNAVPLIKKYGNLVTVNTFSKSRSLAGARVGYVIAAPELIADLKKIKYSFHPYNVNTLSAALAAGAIEDDKYFHESVAKICATRARLSEGLKKLGFRVLPSSANFVLARRMGVSGRELYNYLRSNGILVRHFDDERIDDFIRITVGTDDETYVLLKTLAKMTEENL